MNVAGVVRSFVTHVNYDSLVFVEQIFDFINADATGAISGRSGWLHTRDRTAAFLLYSRITSALGKCGQQG